MSVFLFFSIQPCWDLLPTPSLRPVSQPSSSSLFHGPASCSPAARTILVTCLIKVCSFPHQNSLRLTWENRGDISPQHGSEHILLAPAPGTTHHPQLTGSPHPGDPPAILQTRLILSACLGLYYLFPPTKPFSVCFFIMGHSSGYKILRFSFDHWS